MPPTIVVLDGHTLTPGSPASPGTPGRPADGEPSWAGLEKLGNLTVHPRTPEDQIVPRAADAELVLTNKTALSADTLAQLPALRYVGVLATGVNVVDLEAAKQAGVTVTNAPGYSSASVAQHVFALLLELAQHTAEHDRAVRGDKGDKGGGWAGCEDFSFTVAPLTELAGKTLGIVGVGDIGKRVARIGHALGMTIAAAHQSSMARVSIPGIDIDWMPHDELFAAADAVTLHCPLTDQTRHMVDADTLKRMKPGAYLINTGRGPLLDEAAVAEALSSGRLGGAGLDVLSTEPPSPDNPLLSAPRCIITPHIAWASRESRTRLMGIVTRNVRTFLDGNPENVVSRG